MQNYWFTYNEPMKVESVTKAVCNLAMQFGEGEDAEEGALVWSCIFMRVQLPASLDVAGHLFMDAQ